MKAHGAQIHFFPLIYFPFLPSFISSFFVMICYWGFFVFFFYFPDYLDKRRRYKKRKRECCLAKDLFKKNDCYTWEKNWDWVEAPWTVELNVNTFKSQTVSLPEGSDSPYCT